MQMGSQQIQDRETSLPGRSVQDLVDTQPGWLYEGNAVLHPRGSEYQIQFVIDCIPLTDNRSPSFGPEIGADDLDSMSILTAGFPAVYGRKMGGIVELNTRRQTGDGLHGQVVLSGGSYDTGAAYGQMQEVSGKNTFGATASGSMCAHYLNPVVPENYTNRGTTGDFSAHYERDLTQNDRLSMRVRHELSRFEIPNDLVQQQAGQLQTGGNFETMGIVRYQHIFSPDSLGTLAGMVRDNANNLNSNQNSTPIIAFQHNNFREGFFKATYSLHHGHHEFKAGVESDNAFLHENFSYLITDPTQFDDNTPPSLTFMDHRRDLEQSAFVEDLIRLGNWTVSAGLPGITISSSSTRTPSALASQSAVTCRRSTWCCTPPTTASSRPHRLRASSSPAPRKSTRSTITFFASQSSPPGETTTRVALVKPSLRA
jgi:hypothetical protein